MVLDRRPSNANFAETEAFMRGEKRVLVFSDAGGTGRSYHSDLACANQQPRVHYILEPGWRADTAIQGLGRSHRTNQASPPVFRPVTTDVKGERRFISTIARRLASLGALTKGERQAAGGGLFRPEDSLENLYAQRALQTMVTHLVNDQPQTRARTRARLATRGCALSTASRPPSVQACYAIPEHPHATWVVVELTRRVKPSNFEDVMKS